MQTSSEPCYVRTMNGMERISGFESYLYGIKAENVEQTIGLEQSNSHRSRKPLNAVP